MRFKTDANRIEPEFFRKSVQKIKNALIPRLLEREAAAAAAGNL